MPAVSNARYEQLRLYPRNPDEYTFKAPIAGIWMLQGRGASNRPHTYSTYTNLVKMDKGQIVHTPGPIQMSRRLGR